MKRIFGYFVLFFLLNLARASRIRLCVQTNNYEKLQPTCVLCPSRQQLAKTMELCTGSSEYQSNITFQQAKCLISICNRNQLPSDLQQSNQLIDTKNNNFANKFARPAAGSKQQLVHYSAHHPLNAAEMNGNNLNGLTGLTDQQQSDADAGESTGLSTTSDLMGEQQPVGDLASSGKPAQSTDGAMNGNPASTNPITGNPMAGNMMLGSGATSLSALNGLNGNLNGWAQSTVSPMPNKLIFKRKPFKFRFWPFFG